MLRSLYSGISGLRAQQQMLDVTGNNIANVNTAGFKSSSVQFQDTLSQITKSGTTPQGNAGGTNPAQVGLGVQVAGISTNFAQGSAQSTGKTTDMMISGDGFFVVNKGGQNLYSRDGNFDFDAQGRLVSPDGALLQGYPATNGVLQAGGALANLTVSKEMVAPATATTQTTFGGNLPDEAAVGTTLSRDVSVYDNTGATRNLSLTFTRTAAGWDVAGKDANGATGAGTVAFTAGKQAGANTMAVGGINVDLGSVTGYTGITSVAAASHDGGAAGTLQSFSIGNDGTLTGTFSNGAHMVIGQVAVANFSNPGGLEKSGNSEYRATASSGGATLGTAGQNGLGTLSSGYVEMSNVDLSQEFTNLIVSQRGLQADARVITTSDDVLNELVQLKR